MFIQPLSNRHTCYHQEQHESRQIDNQGGTMSEPSISSVCSSQCTDSCKKSSLSSTSSLPVTHKEHTINKQTHVKCKQQLISNDLISNANNLATMAETKRVQFIDSPTSTEPSSLSLLFEQTTHNRDPFGSEHVIFKKKNAHISISFIDCPKKNAYTFFIELLFTVDFTSRFALHTFHLNV